MSYEYDAANRLVSVTDWNADETTYDYDDAGLVSQVTSSERYYLSDGPWRDDGDGRF